MCAKKCEKPMQISYNILMQNGIIYKNSFFFIVIKKMLPFYLRVITIQKLYS